MAEHRVLSDRTSLRRYLAIVQDPRGYPALGAPLEKAPPDGPAPPMLHQVVKADEHEAEVGRLRGALDKPLRETILAVLRTMPSEAAPEHLAAQIESQVQAWQAIPAAPDEEQACPKCGHPERRHSNAREDDYQCDVEGCRCPGWLPSERRASREEDKDA